MSACAPAHPPVHVLYLAGSGRSGTTVVNNILGQLPGCFAAGELRYLWERGVGQDHPCGCGRPFSECPRLDRRDEAGPGRRHPARRGGGRAKAAAAAAHARLPVLLLRRAAGRPPCRSTPTTAHIARLYRAIADETGASVVIDSSKLPPYGLLLSQLPGITLSVLHVVRDPRATAWSWRRVKASRDRDDAGLMHRHETWKSSSLWTLWNLLSAFLWRAGSPQVCRVRYEDFVRAPQETMAAVARMIGADPDDLPFVAPDRVQLSPTHSVAGNPNRHDTGVVQVRADVEWQSAMPARDQALVSALTLPGLAVFGYPVLPRRHTRPRSAGPASSISEKGTH